MYLHIYMHISMCVYIYIYIYIYIMHWNFTNFKNYSSLVPNCKIWDCVYIFGV